MAKYTFAALVRFAQEVKCGCKSASWSAAIGYDVWRFAVVKTAFPGTADIEGDVGAGIKNDAFASPLALQQKANILGIPMRVK